MDRTIWNPTFDSLRTQRAHCVHTALAATTNLFCRSESGSVTHTFDSHNFMGGMNMKLKAPVALGDLTALLRRPYGVPTARMSERRATARSLSMLKVRAVAWIPRSPHAVQRSFHGVSTELLLSCRRLHCAHHGVLHFFWTPHGLREDAALV